MNMPPSKEPYDGYCGTSYAAKMLGISVGTVQGLVEKNELKAWTTRGGHRRISLQSVPGYQRRHNLVPASLVHGASRLRVLVVEDEAVIRVMLQNQFDQWALPLDVVMYASAMEALVDLPGLHPQVLLTDLRMPGLRDPALCKSGGGGVMTRWTWEGSKAFVRPLSRCATSTTSAPLTPR